MVVRSRVAEFEVLLEPAEEGGFHVWCPRLPGCHSEGDTREAALANIKDAIEGWLEVAREYDHPIPDRASVQVTTDTPVRP
jgi:predicted RNase H-like HicB family nuclease